MSNYFSNGFVHHFSALKQAIYFISVLLNKELLYQVGIMATN